ncbi:saccharopine dehydrogenase NADP-binding domain-containing protein [Flavobacterium psychrophilum]|uniref:Saccharopine dehydrogenase NADP-binding domain-containing protein n=1 Tax=Flavobacterium psychrophilum TaxID=96345 RepID=A0A7U2NFP4_FLAPS|nr:saccharopine dehydrogenase C-terminal domain-containing protein [Flavobacterium psychrophilum]EKT3956781.1 saccharopine dehydrogenase NADP-binding domain-containing protein [Flavobacterium psychrophilum]EKT3963334.1 saccharopine dehydrogenase NADP-binding domain-containing protein [Flavobacterium psychrophilum]EKT3973750.1 saccharopine dehydrogenase NADP-binding domain-containing protein [Flavobacterium psychrophilum]EKT4516779.1 saccharopine dehydrogenase NADP-binding domain-containing prot
MRNVLIIGAGRSASSLIKYLLDKSETENLHLTIGDLSLELAQRKTKNHKNATAIALDIFEANQRQTEIQKADIVISMLPAHLHIEVAKDCVLYKKHMVTASYISDAMQELDAAAKENNLVFMNEIGLDPGIDHMSAMKVIDEIRSKGGKMILFESFCGGLVAPESDNNLWNYKFTWAPRNVVLAGQGGAAKFIQEGTYKYIPYHKLFRRTEFLEVEDYGRFEGYANRDSLKYRSIYGLDDALTLYRGTIRKVGYSKAWNMFVQLGMTDDSYIIDDSQTISYREFVNLFLPYHPTDSVEIKLRLSLGIEQDDIMWDKLLELDLFNKNKIVGLKDATPAQILEKILTDSWTLQPQDKDMIVMYHKFGYELNGNQHQIDSKMVCIGDDQTYTAMAKTVGLPVAMATLQILNKKITTPGVQLPINSEVYLPILKELEEFGIHFKETQMPYVGYNPDKIRN